MLFPALRVILLIAAIGLVVFLLHSIKKSKMSIEDALLDGLLISHPTDEHLSGNPLLSL